MQIVFSTIACPDWTLRDIAARSEDWGFDGVELVTHGPSASDLAAEPFHSDERRTRERFTAAGTPVLSLATPVRFDDPISPPIIGRAISDTERSVRESKRCVDLAAQLDCPVVRVFAFENPKGERVAQSMARIVERLRLAVEDANGTGVRVAVQNGGSFESAAELMELIEKVDRSALGACYSLPVGVHAGDDPEEAVEILGSRLVLTRVADLAGGRPAPLGEGDLPVRAFVASLERSGFEGTLVYEWDRLWNGASEGGPTVEEALRDAARLLHEWMFEARAARPRQGSGSGSGLGTGHTSELQGA